MLDKVVQNKVAKAIVTPEGDMDVLSLAEVQRLQDISDGGLHKIFRQCCLAVLNCGSNMDDAEEVLSSFADFDVHVVQQYRGLKLEIDNAPASAFVDGEMIVGIRDNLFSVLRDIVYIHGELLGNCALDLSNSEGITNAVFHILRHANVLRPRIKPDTVVCWGGHSINSYEYQYTKKVGYELGLRHLNICTGCGPGAMKGPMKGANIAHAKQRVSDGRYIGITEPGIIAAESPNPIVNQLVIMPDIEKRLEAFVRLGHGIIVFPGGVGTAEEILYLLGILLHPRNADLPYPLVFTGPASAASYFGLIDEFIAETLGEEARSRYQIIIDDPAAAARAMKQGMEKVTAFRKLHSDAYHFNWVLHVDDHFQQPFEPSHENMASLNLHLGQESWKLAANLRRAMSGIVAGNVKANGIQAIKQHGPYHISGDTGLMQRLDALLEAFVEEKRMKINASRYVPCYRVIR
ncbi:LOG family protein [Pokkaliibacter plantistimulans]|uniref:AMP nucleosidase n=1 Tax=Proteobacteria bacterium 228 TaxID=2083153 RepID=A0A2S5KJM9_9PROT|nr:nucleotide 5'-monophosphate nucleosidase PpnN [Pokkaliibacter plantistimulans]PPC74835.1 LOG family protein [Pokkaliibacter plantistimulans]